MRLGENENCILCRGESSCIVPISRAAVHTKPDGSRAAIGFFNDSKNSLGGNGGHWGARTARLMIGRNTMGATRRETAAIEPPLGRLERAFIDEFIVARGYDPLKLENLPQLERVRLLKEACAYASAKLAEVESRSHLIHDIHDK